MIPDAVIHQILDRTDIVELIGAQVVLKRAGRNFKACCPFHSEKSPSFIVSPDKQIYHCFGCGAGGNAISFVMKHGRKDFREAVEDLAERARVELPKERAVDPKVAERFSQFAAANRFAADFFQDVLLKRKEGDPGRVYFKKRGIDEKTINDFKLGYAPPGWDALASAAKGKFSEDILEKLGLVLSKKEGGVYDRFRARVMFPILDAKGAVVAFGGRILDDSQPKYLNSPESEVYTKGRHLYGLYQARTAIRDRDFAVVVEGYMDLIACHRNGVPNAVASLGTALTDDQARLIKRHTKNATILYDADKAGEMATLRGLEVLIAEGIEVKIVRLPKGHDPDSYTKEFGTAKFQEAVNAAQTLFDYKLAFLKQQFNPATVEGKVRIAGEMVGLFAKAQNEILRSAWLKALAKELDLSEDALTREMQKSAKGRPAQAPAPVKAAETGTEHAVPVEKLLIGLFLDDPRFVEAARNEIGPSDFQYPAAKRIAQELWNAGLKKVSAAELVNRHREEPDAVTLVSEASAEAETLTDRKKAFEDCLIFLKRSRLAHERQTLQSEIKAAETAGDKNRVAQLLNDINRLNRGIKQSYEKK